MRDLGAAISPLNAFQFIQGLETLPLRIRQHNENAIKVAEFLRTHPKVARVIFPKFQEGEAEARAEKYLRNGHFGALVGFELIANIGDARSLAIHPATTTHSQLTEEDQLKTGVTPGYVRLSIGIEHPDDLVADLSNALSVA
ncbi:L-methionine gamma-lyase [compost metagenome]